MHTRIKTLASTIVVFCILFFSFQSCSFSPVAWSPPAKPELIGPIAENELLSTTEWIDLGGWYGPEDIAIDSVGNLYCGVHVSKKDFSDGRILKIDTLGVISTYCNTGSWVAGLHFDAQGNLIACDQKRGLIRVDQQGRITILASEDEQGNKFLIPNDVDIASDGMIYFSNTSSKYRFSRSNIRKVLLEVKPDGGLYRYDPATRQVTSLIDSSFFGNGVAVSQHSDFVLMADLTKYRILRHWLKGEQQGQTEVFVENLPGLPNGISRRADGSFWVGFSTRRNDLLDKIQGKPVIKKMLVAIPWLQPKQEAYGMLMQVSEEGEVLKTYYDTTGEKVAEASSVEEHNGHLYLGGDVAGHIGKYKLAD